jgi:diguanylate cyclase (GGDEF)-like protein
VSIDPGSSTSKLDDDVLHRLVVRHVRKLGLHTDTSPDVHQWQEFLQRVSAAYSEADQQRYLIERSTRIAAEEMQQLHAEMRRRAETDLLTGLANRGSVVAILEERLAAHSVNDRTTLLFIDLDEFKQINDTLGHGAGDHVLTIAADRLRRVARDPSVAGRLSGDEFVVVAPGQDLRQGQSTASCILDSLREPIAVAGQTLRLSASIGLATAEGPGRATSELLREADSQMYAHKRSRRRRSTDVPRSSPVPNGGDR